MVLAAIDLFIQAPPSADGVILLGQGVHDDAAAVIAATGLPYVVWGAEHGPPGRIVVGSDNREGAGSRPNIWSSVGGGGCCSWGMPGMARPRTA